MILTAMALAAVGSSGYGRAEQARDARFPRLVTLLLDTIFVGILTSIATAVYGVTVVTWGSPLPANGVAMWGSQTTIPAIWTGAMWIGYYIVCEAMFSATPGKALNGLRVVSVDGRPLSAWRVVARNLVRVLDALPALYVIGGFSVLVTANSQRLGDLLGGTTVVPRRYAVEPGTARSSGRTARIVLVVAVATALVFTAAFDYFERPVLVIQGEFNQRQLVDHDVVSYSLGAPTRTLDTVTYPITARTASTTCSGFITLYWQGLSGWQMNGARLDCPPPSS